MVGDGGFSCFAAPPRRYSETVELMLFLGHFHGVGVRLCLFLARHCVFPKNVELMPFVLSFYVVWVRLGLLLHISENVELMLFLGLFGGVGMCLRPGCVLGLFETSNGCCLSVVLGGFGAQRQKSGVFVSAGHFFFRRHIYKEKKKFFSSSSR